MSTLDISQDLAELDAARQKDEEAAAQARLGGGSTNTATGSAAPAAAQKATGTLDKLQQFDGEADRWTQRLPRNITLGLFDSAVNTWESLKSGFHSLFNGDPENTQGTFTAGAYTPPATAADRRQLSTYLDHVKADSDTLSSIRAFREHFSENDSSSDQVTQGVAQFAIPFMGWSKLFNGFGAVSKLGKIAQVAGAETATATTAFDPHAGRMADLYSLGQHTEGKLGDALNAIAPDGSLMNQYIDYMTDRSSEGEAEGRFKNAVDNLTGSAAIAGLIKTGALTFKAARATPEYLKNLKAPEVPSGADMLLPSSSGDTSAAVSDFLDKALRLHAAEARGQDVLDAMSSTGESPRQVAAQFWRDTYYKLNAQTQQRFQRYAKSMGFEPGDVLSIGPNKEKRIARDWQDVGEFLGEDMPKSADDLEGTDRGFVALMKSANAHADTLASSAVSPDALAARSLRSTGSPQAAVTHLRDLPGVTNAERATATDIAQRGIPPEIHMAETPDGHTVFVNRKPVVTFAKPEDAEAAVVDTRNMLGQGFEHRLQESSATLTDKNFDTLHTFSRVLQQNVDRPASTHSLVMALEQNLKGDTEQGAFYKELLGRLSAKRLGGTTTVVKGKSGDLAKAGYWRSADNGIEIHPAAFKDPGRLLHTFTHEAVHAATVNEMVMVPRVYRQMQRLQTAVEKHVRGKIETGDQALGALEDAGDTYGLRDPYEFVAEIESNPEFRKTMQATTLSDGTKVWDKYLETIAGILGVGGLIATPQARKEFNKLMDPQQEKPSA